MTMMNASNENETLEEAAGYEGIAYVLIAIACSILTVVTTLGNLFVILAFILDRRLRKYSNYFILNLSICDLLIGCPCMLFYTPYLLTGEWRMGHALCIIWLVFDYIACTASVMTIMVISLDRYISIRHAVKYHTKQSLRRAIFFIAIVWIVAFLNYGPAIILWEHVTGRRTVPWNQCFVEFRESLVYILVTACVEFFTPFTSVSILNILICVFLRRRRQHHRVPAQPNAQQSPTQTGGGQLRPCRLKELPSSATGTPAHATLGNNLNSSSDIGGCAPLTEDIELQEMIPITPPAHGQGPFANVYRTPSHRRHRRATERDRKAARSLALLVLVFFICWFPYTLSVLINAVCRHQCVNSVFFEVAFWLLWMNSTLNPFLYPLLQNQFRQAYLQTFYKIIRICRPSDHRHEYHYHNRNVHRHNHNSNHTNNNHRNHNSSVYYHSHDFRQPKQQQDEQQQQQDDEDSLQEEEQQQSPPPIPPPPLLSPQQQQQPVYRKSLVVISRCRPAFRPDCVSV